MSPSRPYRAVVIPTRDRPGMLADCVSSVVDQVDSVFIIDNGSQPPVDSSAWMRPGERRRVFATQVALDPPNISRLWNEGIEQADGDAWVNCRERWDIAVLNDDAIIPPGWIDTLSTAMRETTAVLAYPDQSGGQQQILHTTAGPVGLQQRITGYAYMLRGEAGLRIDESMAWHYSDDDIDWQAREAGGALLVPGIPVQHRAPDVQMSARPELQAQAGRDRATFQAKWGRTPW